VATARFLVTGRVQGVFFRASTRNEAERLGLAGTASNLDDGRVEVVASGTDAALDALEKWLWQGPPAARVDEVVREAVDDRAMDGFRTG
jgi:acylphosphatase